MPEGHGAPSSYEEAVAAYQLVRKSKSVSTANQLTAKAGLAQMKLWGWGTEIDRRGAVELLRSIESTFHDRAMTGLGQVGLRVVGAVSPRCLDATAHLRVLPQCYLYGWGGVPRDYIKAMKHFRLACQGKYGDPIAMFEYGRM